jgi:hypothetical protein
MSEYRVEQIPDGWKAWVTSDVRLQVIERNRELALESIRQLHLDKIEADRRIDQLIKKK